MAGDERECRRRVALTSCGEVFTQLAGVLLYGRADPEMPLLRCEKRRKKHKSMKHRATGRTSR